MKNCNLLIYYFMCKGIYLFLIVEQFANQVRGSKDRTREMDLCLARDRDNSGQGGSVQ